LISQQSADTVTRVTTTGRDKLRVFGFPNPVNEVAARLVAAGVVVQCVAFLATGWGWLLVPLAYGFLARVLTGPRLSPLGRFVTGFGVPRLPWAARPVPGPPKRFAQAIGMVLSATAALSWLAGVSLVGYASVAAILLAATLESVFAICLGCKIFAVLMRHGVIPASVCAECGDLSKRLGAVG
jgi:hypothetical protein